MLALACVLLAGPASSCANEEPTADAELRTATLVTATATPPAPGGPGQIVFEGERQVSITEGERANPGMPGTGELAHIFSSVDGMYRSAPVVALVLVMEASAEPHGGLPFTRAQVEVLEGLKGVETGRMLTVVELGGPFAGRSKDPNEPTAEPVDLGTPAGPMMKAGETWLLFLDGPANVGAYRGGAYGVIGAFQGRFRVGTDGRIAFMGDPRALDDLEFATQRELRGLRIEDVVQVLRTAE